MGRDGKEHHRRGSYITYEQTNVLQRPSADKLGEEGCGGEDTYWGEWGTICNYELVLLLAGPGDTVAPEQAGNPSVSATLEHSTKENGNCLILCKACAAETKAMPEVSK